MLLKEPYRAVFAIVALLVVSCSSKGAVDTIPKAETPDDVSHDIKSLRSDYLFACQSIADGYVYLKEKTGQSPKAFYASSLIRAESIGINGRDTAANDFIAALRELRAGFADGHFGWSIDRNLGRASSMTLGMTATFIGNELVVAAVQWPEAERGERPGVGDIIVSIDGKQAIQAVEELGRRIPQSTRRSTLEFAARYVGFEPAWMPLRDGLASVSIGYRRADGTTGKAVMDWENGRPTLTRNAIPSLEEIPEGAIELSGELFYYTLIVNGKRFAVVHPRAFLDWTGGDVDVALRKAKSDGANALVIDLKDSAGGAFNQVVLLLRALGVDDPMAFTLRTVDPSSGAIIEEHGDFASLERESTRTETWRGQVIVRTNAIAGSACDFFACAVKRAGRATIIGEGTAGRGGGTDTVTLPRTGAEIDIPRRDRTLDGPNGRIEGNGVEPDYAGEGSLPELLSGFISEYES